MMHAPRCSALEEWEARIQDLALISKLAAQLWGYLGVGGCCCWGWLCR